MIEWKKTPNEFLDKITEPVSILGFPFSCMAGVY